MSNTPARRNQPRWGTKEDAAEYLGCHTRTIRRMVAEGTLPAYRLGPRMMRIDLNDLDDLMRRIPTVGDAA